jgi:hypothetical protein
MYFLFFKKRTQNSLPISYKMQDQCRDTRSHRVRVVVLATGMMLLVAVAAVLISTDARPSALLESAADLVSAR